MYKTREVSTEINPNIRRHVRLVHVLKILSVSGQDRPFLGRYYDHMLTELSTV
jgi:hypothetical protein